MNKTLIIAEAGVNHNGDILIAEKLIEQAAISGADIVKFQTFNTSDLVTKNAPKAEYQLINENRSKNQLELLKGLELNEKQFNLLRKHCGKYNIEFLSTAFDNKSLSMLEKFNLKRNKIPSGEITNLPLLKRIGAYNKDVILSSGMANLGEIEMAINILEKAGTKRSKITVLHCTSEYPAPISEVNLSAIDTISKALKVKVGYSDHTEGTFISIAAVALGAKIIEKHLTLDRKMEGPDHLASIEPSEFKEMCDKIRDTEIALGDGIKEPTLSEKRNMISVRKSIFASTQIKKGEIFTENNLIIKRPGNGISPLKFEELLGKESNKDYSKDESIDKIL